MRRRWYWSREVWSCEDVWGLDDRRRWGFCAFDLPFLEGRGVGGGRAERAERAFERSAERKGGGVIGGSLVGFRWEGRASHGYFTHILPSYSYSLEDSSLHIKMSSEQVLKQHHITNLGSLASICFLVDYTVQTVPSAMRPHAQCITKRPIQSMQCLPPR